VGPEQIAATCQILEFAVRHGPELSAAMQRVAARPNA
jgi:hypothetical protein